MLRHEAILKDQPVMKPEDRMHVSDYANDADDESDDCGISVTEGFDSRSSTPDEDEGD